jgi:hypothetical protein
MKNALPLPEACRLAGVPLSTGQALLRRDRGLAAGWQRNRRGKPTPLVDAARLRGAAYQGGGKVSARFAHRCRVAGVDPARALWSIVSGSRGDDGRHDLDMIGDAMRLALEEGAGAQFLREGALACAFLAALGGRRIDALSMSFDIQLANLLRKQAAARKERIPKGDFEQLWKKLIIAVCKNPTWRKTKPLVVRDEDSAGGATIRLRVDPLYNRGWRVAAVFSGEPRAGDRDASTKRARQESEANKRLIHLAAGEVAKRLFPAGGGVNTEGSKSLGAAFRLMAAAHLRRGERQPSPSEVNAAEALRIMQEDLDIARSMAWPFLLAYWRRMARDLLPPSPSAVRAAFQLKSRARPGSGPRRKPKAKFRRETASERAQAICQRYCDDTLSASQRKIVARVIAQLLQLEKEGRADSRDNLAQALGYAKGGADFRAAFPDKLITAAHQCLEDESIETLFSKSGEEPGQMAN